ncbi:TPA: helix-turn-helix transcriptional regulator [Salmonella enterica subsp. enterica serovar Concord]|nr:helix-turn-helix transcriptional regulator [Salmonella enterica subsp. enterica serovar Concord]
MTNSSIDYSQKLRQIREAEGLTQKQFAELTGLSITTVKSYEGSKQPARAKIVEAVLQADLFEKYMFWLIKDKTFPQAGQISPALSPDGPERHTESQGLTQPAQKLRRSRRNAG